MTNAEARFNKSHIHKVYACLAVTCHLHFWQNDRDLLRSTAVTRGWNGYQNKNQHRKSTLEKKILPPLQQGFEPATFQSRVRRSNHWAIPAVPFVRYGVYRLFHTHLQSCTRSSENRADIILIGWLGSKHQLIILAKIFREVLVRTAHKVAN